MLDLAEGKGFTLTEIATRTGCPLRSVQVLHKDGLRQLARDLLTSANDHDTAGRRYVGRR